MGSGQSTQPNFQRRPQVEVRDHMERLQRISDLKVKPVIKDGGVLELSVKYDRHARNRLLETVIG